MLITVVSSIITTFLTVPLFGFILVFLLFKLITKNSRKSIHNALDYSTILFIISVHFLIITIWGRSLFWLIILVLIFFAMAFVVIHWKVKGEIVITKVIKGFWRFSFLIFFAVYVTLTVYGFLHRAVIYTFFS